MGRVFVISSTGGCVAAASQRQSITSAAPLPPDRHTHKRLHKGGVLGSGLAGVGALAKIGAGWRVAGLPGESSDTAPILTK
ncbi:hypothetical protein NX80_014450 [Xanthomonas vasicola pv. arecae]|nr:hypothetical protein NX80_014450 [Xanthomonas vasicola pv. arecae]